jgi:hypothetical protein
MIRASNFCGSISALIALLSRIVGNSETATLIGFTAK